MNRMHSSRGWRILVCGALLGAAIGASAEETTSDSLADAIANGDVGLKLNYRFEFVDQDGFDEDAKASTLLTRLNYRTGVWQGFSAFLELDDVSEIGPDDYNGGAGTTPDRTRFPVVADPADTRVNQAYLDYRPTGDWLIRGGRQRIKLDNDRFVGNVGWRQNEQTYDAASLQYKNEQWAFHYSYVFHVNRIFGDDVPAGNHDHNTQLANVSYVFRPRQKLTAYWYEIDNNDVLTDSTSTYGIRYTGNVDINGHALGLTGEYAHQTDSDDNPADFSANYWHGDVAYAFHPAAKLSVGYEVLSGSSRAGRAFRTPLATLHAFNGWADRFLATPDAGLKDFFLGLSGRYDRFNWNIVWHQFDAEVGSGDFGSELDAALNVRLHDKVKLLLKAAFFDSDSPNLPDTDKFWAMVTADF